MGHFDKQALAKRQSRCDGIEAHGHKPLTSGSFGDFDQLPTASRHAMKVMAYGVGRRVLWANPQSVKFLTNSAKDDQPKEKYSRGFASTPGQGHRYAGA
jgi:hypothetical protein